MKKKLIAALTSAAMVATMVPATAFAVTDSGAPTSAPVAVAAAENESEAVTAFKDAVKKIPEEGAEGYGYTDAYKAALDAARVAYDKLTSGEKEQAKNECNNLTAAETQYNEWKEAVNNVIGMIDALPDKIGLTAADGVAAYADVYTATGDLQETINAYAKLKDVAGQQDSVTNKDKLYAVGGNDQGGMVTNVGYCAVNKAIGAIAELPGITGQNYKNALNGAKEKVDNLTTAQRAVLAQDVMSKYQKAENTVNKATKLMQAYDDAYEALTKKYAKANAVTAENVADADALCKAVEEAYAALSEIGSLQNAAANYNNLQRIRNKITALQNDATANEEAQPVLDRIAALPKASDVKDMSLYDEVNAIFDAYNQLEQAAKTVVTKSIRADEFNAVAAAVAAVYNNMTAEAQAARAKAALAQLPSDDYEINQTAQTEYKMATGSNVNVPHIGKSDYEPKKYVGKAAETEKYFTQNEIDKYNAAKSGLKAAYQAEVDAIKELIKGLEAEKIENMNATEFAAAKSTIDQAEAAVAALSPGAEAVYEKDDVKTTVDGLIEARDTYLMNAAADGLKARMDSIVTITPDNLAAQKPIIEALRADYDAFAKDVENGVYGDSNKSNNPFNGGAYETALGYLTDAEAEIAALELGQDAAKVDEAIEALTILDADKTYTAEELLAAQAANAAAREAYENLSADEAGEVTKYAKLVEAEKAVVAASQKTIDTEAEKIGNVGLTLTDAQIQQYKVVYDLLSALGKDTSADTNAISGDSPGQGYYKAAIAKLNVMYPNATKVSDQLSDLNENSSAADILAAREAYDALSDIEKTLVSQEALDNLLDVEKNGKNSDKLLSKATVAAIADQEYTGDQIRPTLTVTSADKKTLKEGTDYTVTYNNNVLVGTATVTITGTGDYAGTITAAFDIVGISINDATVTVANQQTYTGSALTPAVTVKVDGKELTTADYDVAYSNNTNVGTATVTITGKGNYAGTATAKFEIVKANIQKASVTGVANRYYTGKARTQTDLRVYIAGKVLSTDNYSVVYKNNTNIGQASLTITGKGNYTGTITKTFIVKPRKVASVKVTKGKKRVTVRYKKQNGARYQIYYKKAGTKAKTVKTAAVKRTIKKLKSGKTYTIKVRAYKKIGSKTYYGKYSKAKKVRVR